jgi:hypothetical protein
MNFDHVPITDENDRVLPLDTSEKDPDDMILHSDCYEFQLEYEEVEDFIEEARINLEMFHLTDCILQVN